MTLKSISKSPKRQQEEKSMYVLKLERCNQDLLKLREKLCSYVCEPTTYNLFERIEILRNRLETMRDSNLNIMEGIKKDADVLYAYFAKAEQNLSDFNSLYKAIENYVSSARPCK
ncbi:hypothetical protein [Costertonia aggregata]|uniref:Uncharacterized protein n=1 Tax=Costertonia aggregata TaxID=343403 RepID=A0A7H9ATZ9_9FLAO|nr:hypothetical protein [Costertonia aggregata]QLG46948.1 hypothetical protein HYG79_16835 [Costertonia aggregata]